MTGIPMGQMAYLPVTNMNCWFFDGTYPKYGCDIEVRQKKNKIGIFFYGKNMKKIWIAFLVIYDLFMIYLWFLGFPLFFIDFPKEFLEIFEFSLIFLEFFLKSLIFWMIWIYFFEFSLGISWNFLEIIKKS